MIPDNLPELARLLGTLPPGDTPAAWWYADDPAVLGAYEEWEKDHAAWREKLEALCRTQLQLSAPELRIGGYGGDYLLGIYAPRTRTVPRWWRATPEGYLVPRKRTRAEKKSGASLGFAELRKIPRAVDYLPGLPDTLWTPTQAYPVQVRRPGEAVLAFVGLDPSQASPAFDPSPALWHRLKLSSYHLLRERQEASQTAS